MIDPNPISLLCFHQLRMLFSFYKLLLFEYIPSAILNHLHVAVLCVKRFFNLLRFNKLFRMVFTNQTLPIFVILLPDLSQLQIAIDVFLGIVTILCSEYFSFFLKFDLMNVFHELRHLLVILH